MSHFDIMMQGLEWAGLSYQQYQEHIDQHFFIEQQRQIRLARQAILTFQCQNTKYGCQETLKAEERVDHEKYCDYQKVHCWMGQYIDL